MRKVKQPRPTAAARPQHVRMLVIEDHIPVVPLPKRFRLSLSSMVLWLAVLTLVATQPAAAGWGPRSFLTGFAVYSGPSSGSVESLMSQNHSLIATTATGSDSSAVGSALHALDQCGGEGGLCNATTIGIPCGDHPWGGVYCPDNFNCSRSNVSWWSCTLIPGRTPHAAEKEWMDAHDPAKAKNKTRNRKPVTRHSRTSSPYRANEEAADREAYRQPENQQGPIVPVCGPAQLAGRGTAMCNRSSDGFFVNPAAPVPDAASGAGLGLTEPAVAWWLCCCDSLQHYWLRLRYSSWWVANVRRLLNSRAVAWES